MMGSLAMPSSTAEQLSSASLQDTHGQRFGVEARVGQRLRFGVGAGLGSDLGLVPGPGVAAPSQGQTDGGRGPQLQPERRQLPHTAAQMEGG